MEEVQVKLVEAEINVINLKPGDTLAVKVRNFEMEEIEIQGLKDALMQRFPLNRIMVFFLADNGSLEFEVIKAQLTQEENKENSCASANYCANCNCGKKTKALSQNNPPEDEL